MRGIWTVLGVLWTLLTVGSAFRIPGDSMRDEAIRNDATSDPALEKFEVALNNYTRERGFYDAVKSAVAQVKLDSLMAVFKSIANINILSRISSSIINVFDARAYGSGLVNLVHWLTSRMADFHSKYIATGIRSSNFTSEL
ncbi:hypothetical protein GE061_007958 [Apolygus lucorum]|uniref:Uncharacterized protein n=1 Tax=Apolygus lucorum TaxID=248454 RepID=A0A6A4J2A2_APOLU|nr:hypothetical protein GE061_007958 [Apolygus lucorum]